MSIDRRKLLAGFRERIYETERQYFEALFDCYPIGSEESYELAGRKVPFPCTILGHSSDRVKVRGATGKEYWIYGYRLC